MATICKIEKTIKMNGEYPKRLVWAVLGDDGKTLFECYDSSEEGFSACRDWLNRHPQPLVKCLACEE